MVGKQNGMSQSDNSLQGPDVDDLIDRNIRLLYSNFLDEELPDRFKDIIALIRDENPPDDEDGGG